MRKPLLVLAALTCACATGSTAVRDAPETSRAPAPAPEASRAPAPSPEPLCPADPPGALDDAALQRLLEVSGVEEAIALMARMGAEMPASTEGRLEVTEAARRVFDAEPARDFALHWIRVKVEPERAREVLAFFETEPGRTVLTAADRRLTLRRDQLDSVLAGLREQEDHGAREAWAVRMDHAFGLTHLRTGIIRLMVWSGVETMLRSKGLDDRAQVERAYRSILAVDDVEARREAIVRRLVYGTRALSLEQLEEIAAFAGSQSGLWLAAWRNELLRDLKTDVHRRLWVVLDEVAPGAAVGAGSDTHSKAKEDA